MNNSNFVLTGMEVPDPFSTALRFPRKPAPLRAMLVSAGVEVRSDETYDWNGRQRGSSEFALLQVTLEGEGRLKYEGREFVVRPGTAMILHVPHDNRYWLPEDGYWKYYYICLNGTEVLHHWRRIELQAGPLLELAPSSATWRCGLEICRKCRDNLIRTAWEASALAYQLTMSLAADVESLLQEEARSTINLMTEKRLQEARRLAEARYQDPIGVADMVSASEFSRSHFSRKFHARFGVSPVEYLTRLRLRHAVNLLLETSEPVATIAVLSGFSDANYFARVFKGAYGMRPGAYRRGGFVSREIHGRTHVIE